MKRILIAAVLALGLGACIGPDTHATAQAACACARVRGGAEGPCPSCNARSARDICAHCDCPDGRHYGCC